MTRPPYSQSLDHCPAEAAAAEQVALDAACDHVLARLDAGGLPCLTIAERDDDLDVLESTATGIAAFARDLLLVGIGGSSLGARTLAALARAGGPDPRLHVLDNVDPDSVHRILSMVDPARCHVLAVSKSGNTLETLALAMLALDHLGDGVGVTVITEPASPDGGSSRLLVEAEARGFDIIDHEVAIDGRFSVLSGVGLLPALVCGLDARAVRRGAASVLADFRACGADSAPARGAAMAVALDRGRGRHVQIMMPYADRLAPFARWFAQLWAESLGKDGRGSQPVAALGTVDQHSQLQLWIDGPPRTWVTVLGFDQTGAGPAFESTAGFDVLAGLALGDVMEAERAATVESLAAAGVPVRTLMLDRLDEVGLGALFAHFMLETVIAGHMLGVDPFGQPAVEDGKRRALSMLEAMAP